MLSLLRALRIGCTSVLSRASELALGEAERELEGEADGVDEGLADGELEADTLGDDEGDGLELGDADVETAVLSKVACPSGPNATLNVIPSIVCGVNSLAFAAKAARPPISFSMSAAAFRAVAKLRFT